MDEVIREADAPPYVPDIEREPEALRDGVKLARVLSVGSLGVDDHVSEMDVLRIAV